MQRVNLAIHRHPALRSRDLEVQPPARADTSANNPRRCGAAAVRPAGLQDEAVGESELAAFTQVIQYVTGIEIAGFGRALVECFGVGESHHEDNAMLS